MEFDIVLIGGGIVGLATAWELRCRYPDKSLVVLEQESKLATHQTGRNSGVIHAGVYYKPSSLKAKFCQKGNQEILAFCRQHYIPFERCGKLIVATQARELPRLDNLFHRALNNGLEAQLWDAQQAHAAEPNIKALGAIHVGSSAIVDYRMICQTLLELIRVSGGQVMLNHRLIDLQQKTHHLSIQTSQSCLTGKTLIACPGIQADRIVSMLGVTPKFRMVPFRGEYFQLIPDKNDIVKHLIYPVPDPTLPFLGVHITPMIDGSITVGPNAMLALSRYGYNKRDIDWQDLVSTLTYPGVARLLWNNLRPSLNELISSISKTMYTQRVRAMCPMLKSKDLIPYPSGIRAQAVFSDGTMVDDFLFESSNRVLVVCNAPSPAATSAFPIARHVADMAEDLLAA